jgi:DNA-binding NtrC family response regulator
LKVSKGVTMAKLNTPICRSNSGIPPAKVPVVLIAEKDNLLRLMMAKLLQVSGYRVHTCGDGLQALKLVKIQSYDLIITDLVLAGASGIEVLTAAQKIQPRAKVIIVTEVPSSETLLEAKYHGAYAYLRKPLQLRQFLLILQDAVEHSRLRDNCLYQQSTEVAVGKAEPKVDV